MSTQSKISEGDLVKISTLSTTPLYESSLFKETAVESVYERKIMYQASIERLIQTHLVEGGVAPKTIGLVTKVQEMPFPVLLVWGTRLYRVVFGEEAWWVSELDLVKVENEND